MVAAAGMPLSVMVAAAGMPFFVMVVIAVHLRIEGQLPFGIRLRCLVGRSCDTAEERDAGLCQCALGAAADTAADQSICADGFQKACQRTVARSAGAENFGPGHFTVFNVVDLELFCSSEMLEYCAVGIIGYCKSHGVRSFPGGSGRSFLRFQIIVAA